MSILDKIDFPLPVYWYLRGGRKVCIYNDVRPPKQKGIFYVHIGAALQWWDEDLQYIDYKGNHIPDFDLMKRRRGEEEF